MRPLLVIAGLFAPTVLCAAEPVPTAGPSVQSGDQYQLGGVATRAAVVPNIDLSEPDTVAPRSRLSLPLASESLNPQKAMIFGPATVFVGEGLDSGRDAVQVGTFIRNGLARAGISLTFLEQEEEVSRSELFLNYSITDQISVGVSGIFSTLDDTTDTVPQLGLSAEFATESGTYFQGGLADAPEYEPVFGLSIGFRF